MDPMIKRRERERKRGERGEDWGAN